MKITHVYSDNGMGSESIINPTFDEIKEMVLNLNGKNKTFITIGSNSGKESDYFYMTIGGGNNGLYIAFISYKNNNEIHTLIDKTKSKTKSIEIVVDGEIAPHPECYCVNQETILRAIKTFYNEQKPDETLDWERE